MSTKIPDPPTDYQEDSDRYVRWVEDYLDVNLAEAQREILEAMAEHEKLLILAANGFGKSFSMACGTLAFLMTNYPSTVVATSGTYPKLRRTLCKPVDSLHRHARDNYSVPGQYKHAPPRIEFDEEPEWYFEAARPKNPDELEGAHNEHLLGIIEEADKDDVGEDVVGAMESLLTDDRDRLVVIANPPRDEGNIVYELMQDPTWEQLQYSSFDSHNVEVKMGGTDGELVDGLVTLDRIKKDWLSWNNEPWVGVDEARVAHEHRDDLDERWYRRRAGVIPPSGASVHRPVYKHEVQAALDNPMPEKRIRKGIACDIARSGGDYTVAVEIHDTGAVVVDEWQVTDVRGHNENEDRIRDVLERNERQLRCKPVIDAVGEGSHVADIVRRDYGGIRFKAGEEAVSDEYANKWTEALAALGQHLPELSIPDHDRLRKELHATARYVEYEERTVRGDTVLRATSKEDLKEYIEHNSPDHLDALAMAAWSLETSSNRGRRQRGRRPR